MGTDIYLYLEVQDTQGRWQLVPEPVHFFEWNSQGTQRQLNRKLLAEYSQEKSKLPIPLPWNPEEFEAVDGGFSREKWWRLNHPFELAGCRNYSMFAILADVRNGCGLSGCEVAEKFVPISLPKGLPDDISPELFSEVSASFADAYACSHLTLEDLLSYDWERVLVRRGFIGVFEYTYWVKSGLKDRKEGPLSWRGLRPEDEASIVSLEDMDRIVKECGLFEAFVISGNSVNVVNLPKPTDDKIYYTEVVWEEPYSKSAAQFYSSFIPWLKTLDVPSDKLRIVFFFDD